MKNKVQDGRMINFTAGGDIASGDPVVVGVLPGVAAHDVATGATGVIDTQGVFSLAVGGVDHAGNSAVAVGDQLYFTAGDTPKINKKNTGTVFGVALGTVTSAGTGTINIRIG